MCSVINPAYLRIAFTKTRFINDSKSVVLGEEQSDDNTFVTVSIVIRLTLLGIQEGFLAWWRRLISLFVVLHHISLIYHNGPE